MLACYLCSTNFTKENSSLEHILLNAIGGRLKSKQLLCKSCNSKFGSECDKTLAKELAFLSSFIEVKRDKGHIQDIKGGKTSSGITYNLLEGHKPQISKPLISAPTSENPFINIKARNESEALEIIKGLKRKYPNLNDMDAKSNLVAEEYYIQEAITFNFGVGGDDTFRSLTKSAINYFILEQNDTTYIRHLFPYLRGEENRKVAKHFLGVNVEKIHDQEVAHLIHLESNNGLLYCYIELFSSYSFIVLLNSNYSSEPVNKTYCYDLIKNRKIKKLVSLNLTKDHFDFNSILTQFDVSKLQDRLNNVMKISEGIKIKREVKAIIDDGFNKTMEKYSHPEFLNKEMRREMAQYISSRFVQFMYRGDT